MYQTIQLSSCITVQGEFVAQLHDGRIAIRDGETVYRGHPIQRRQPSVAIAALRGTERPSRAL